MGFNSEEEIDYVRKKTRPFVIRKGIKRLDQPEMFYRMTPNAKYANGLILFPKIVIFTI